MKIWLDDIRPTPEGYTWCKSVNEVKALIENNSIIVELNLDHDLGDYAKDGGDGIKLLDWLEETERSFPIHIHSMNPVGVANMRRIIKANNWKEI